MVVLSGVVLPQCLQPTVTPIRLDLLMRNTGENQITLRCRWCSNFSDVQDPHLFVNSTDNPVQFRLENGLLTFNISQEMEGEYYCGDSPNKIGSNSVTLIGENQAWNISELAPPLDLFRLAIGETEEVSRFWKRTQLSRLSLKTLQGSFML